MDLFLSNINCCNHPLDIIILCLRAPEKRIIKSFSEALLKTLLIHLLYFRVVFLSVRIDTSPCDVSEGKADFK